MTYNNPTWVYDNEGNRTGIVCDGGVTIPNDPDNRDYQYLMELVQSNEITINEPN